MYACASECSCKPLQDFRKDQLFRAGAQVIKAAIKHASDSEAEKFCNLADQATAYAHPSFPPGIDQYKIKPRTPAKAPVTSA